MKKEEFIRLIQTTVADGAEVVLFDHRKNLGDDIGDGSGAGIYHSFSVEQFTEREVADGCIPFAAIIFDNEDYSDDGECLL